MRRLLIAGRSGNGKLGLGVVATYRPVVDTCPNSCPLAGKGCYAERSLVKMVSNRSRKRADALEEMDGAPLIRHHVSGDVCYRDAQGKSHIDKPYVLELIAWHTRNPNSVGWIYTHAAPELESAGFSPTCWPENLHVLASCNSLEESKRLQAAGWRTARVSESLDRQRGEVYCPYDLTKKAGDKQKTTCTKCRICFARKQNIVFMRF